MTMESVSLTTGSVMVSMTVQIPVMNIVVSPCYAHTKAARCVPNVLLYMLYVYLSLYTVYT